MRKNILMLINGFGIEQNDSYNVYSENLMPNLDRLTKLGIFGSINTTDFDYKEGYRKFSIGITEELTYNIVNNALYSESFKNNDVFKYIINDLNIDNRRLHVICFWDNDSTIYQLIGYLKEILNKTNSNIFVHIIFKQLSIKEYKNIEKNLNTLNYEFGSRVKIGALSGFNNSNFYKDFIKMLIYETGEKWKDISKKIDVLKESRTKPIDSRIFSLNSGFSIKDNDNILYFNYSNVDVTSFTNEFINSKRVDLNLSTIKFYSLFPVISNNLNVPYLYEYALSSTYTLDSLKKVNAKCIVMAKKDHCNIINYYLTGLRNNYDNDLRYMATDNNFIYDSTTLLNTISTLNENLIIINYDIDDCKTIEEIQNKLSKIDVVIGNVYDYVMKNNFALFISSLYGIEKEMYNSKHELCKVNFSNRSMIILLDNLIDKSKYVLNEGTSYDLSNTIMWNINNSYKNSGLLKKKSGIMSIFYK